MPAKRVPAHQPYRPKSARLFDQDRESLSYHHYSYKTGHAWIHWILRFIRFNATRHPAKLGKPEIKRFLIHLAIDRAVQESTPCKALNAIFFLSPCSRLSALR